jgi:hypothetical protein
VEKTVNNLSRPEGDPMETPFFYSSPSRMRVLLTLQGFSAKGGVGILVGEGSIGKSTLILEFLRRCKDPIFRKIYSPFPYGKVDFYYQELNRFFGKELPETELRKKIQEELKKGILYIMVIDHLEKADSLKEVEGLWEFLKKASIPSSPPPTLLLLSRKPVLTHLGETISIPPLQGDELQGFLEFYMRTYLPQLEISPHLKDLLLSQCGGDLSLLVRTLSLLKEKILSEGIAYLPSFPLETLMAYLLPTSLKEAPPPPSKVPTKEPVPPPSPPKSPSFTQMEKPFTPKEREKTTHEEPLEDLVSTLKEEVSEEEIPIEVEVPSQEEEMGFSSTEEEEVPIPIQTKEKREIGGEEEELDIDAMLKEVEKEETKKEEEDLDSLLNQLTPSTPPPPPPKPKPEKPPFQPPPPQKSSPKPPPAKEEIEEVDDEITQILKEIENEP